MQLKSVVSNVVLAFKKLNYPFNYHIDDAQETMNHAVAPIIH